jgi:hypothetical protein
MGYVNNVFVAVAFRSAEQAEEIMAVYAIHPSVQEQGTASEWELKPMGDKGFVSLIWENDYVKNWYEGNETYDAVMHMLTTLLMFEEEREGFSYAYRIMRIGESYEDIETDNCGTDIDLSNELCRRMDIKRELTTNF